MDDRTLHVELRGISKRFGTTQAVDGASLAVERGSIHGLVGENGAGKSTVGKIISGVYSADSGSLLVNGRAESFRTPRQAFGAGITTIAQELSLLKDRSVADNVFCGVEATRLGFMSRRETQRRFAELTAGTGIRLDPAPKAGSLSVAEQQLVEILRAAARGAEFVIMDEPSARLSGTERDQLHRLLREMRGRGTTVLLISHFLQEVLDLSDAVTVMRDGRIVRTADAREETVDSLIEAMIGRQLSGNYPPKAMRTASSRPEKAETPALRVRGLRRPGLGAQHGLDLDVFSGEIVGLAGLVGAGRTEFVRAVYGADPMAEGEIQIAGERLVQPSRRAFRRARWRNRFRPTRAIRHGLGLIPESRRDQGLLPDRSLRENVSLPHLKQTTKAGVVVRRVERNFVDAAVSGAEVRGGGLETPIHLLSGGNQQKSLFARWMVPGLKVLIADEPTRGVDVGSKRSIYDLIASAAGRGLAVLIVSSELEELIGLCHRIVVMRNGQFVAEFAHPHLDEAQILRQAFGGEPTPFPDGLKVAPQ